MADFVIRFFPDLRGITLLVWQSACQFCNFVQSIAFWLRPAAATRNCYRPQFWSYIVALAQIALHTTGSPLAAIRIARSTDGE